MKKKEKEISILITYVGLILGIALYFFSTPFALKYLGKNEFGVYSLVYTIVSYFTILDFGFGNAIVRYTSKYLALKNDDKLKQINGLFLITYTVIGIIALFIGLILITKSDSIFKSLTLEEIKLVKLMLNIALINIVLSFPLSVFQSILKGYGKFIISEVVHVFKILLSPLSIFLAIRLNLNCVGIIIIQTVTNILVALIPLYYCCFKLNIKFSLKKSKDNFEMFKEIVKFSFYVFLGLIVIKVFWSTDQIILGAYVGSFSVSVCSLISQIVQYYSSISETITKPYLTIITKEITLAKNKTLNFTNTFIKIGRVQYYLLFLIMSGFIVFGKEFIILWAGKDFIEVYYLSICILIPLTIPAIQNVGVAILQSLNIHKFRSIVYFVIAILNVILSLLLVNKYGIHGTTFGTVSSLVIGHVIIMNIYYKRRLNLNLFKFWSNIFVITIKVLPLTILSFIFNYYFSLNNSWILLFIKIFVYAILYFSILYFVVFSLDEKKSIKLFFERGKKA